MLKPFSKWDHQKNCSWQKLVQSVFWHSVFDFLCGGIQWQHQGSKTFCTNIGQSYMNLKIIGKYVMIGWWMKLSRRRTCNKDEDLEERHKKAYIYCPVGRLWTCREDRREAGCYSGVKWGDGCHRNKKGVPPSTLSTFL